MRNKTIAEVLDELREIFEEETGATGGTFHCRLKKLEHLTTLAADQALAQRDAAQPAPTSGWMPIETAPKDSKARLVWCPARKNCYLVTWDGRYEGEWTHFCSGGISLSEEPTHWMPLPEAP